MPKKPRGKPWGRKPKPAQSYEDIKTRIRKDGSCCRGGPLASFCKACPMRPASTRTEGR